MGISATETSLGCVWCVWVGILICEIYLMVFRLTGERCRMGHPGDIRTPPPPLGYSTGVEHAGSVLPQCRSQEQLACLGEDPTPHEFAVVCRDILPCLLSDKVWCNLSAKHLMYVCATSSSVVPFLGVLLELIFG
jgi:hypothetical protein